jgi:hypothetical protein
MTVTLSKPFFLHSSEVSKPGFVLDALVQALGVPVHPVQNTICKLRQNGVFVVFLIEEKQR